MSGRDYSLSEEQKASLRRLAAERVEAELFGTDAAAEVADRNLMEYVETLVRVYGAATAPSTWQDNGSSFPEEG